MIIAAVSLPVLLVLIILLHINSLLDKIHYDTGSMPDMSTASPTLEDEEITPGAEDSAQSEIDALEAEIIANLQAGSTDIAYNDNVYNILLIGSDSRTGTGYGRSDAMILLSINKNTKTIVMTSLMRDIYLSISGHNSNRLNAAYAFGGPDLLLDTIRSNFKISVEKYISVNFFSFIEIIDALGGVTVDISGAECLSMNGYIHELNVLLGLPADDEKLDAGGDNLHLSGKQALAYTRVRYVGNADFERTERQRIVMDQVYDKLKEQSITELYGILNDFLPKVTTNLSKGEIFTLLLSAPVYAGYPLEQYRVPANGTYKGLMINGKSVLGIDFKKNIAYMQENIYN